jgi:hypothetical protein
VQPNLRLKINFFKKKRFVGDVLFILVAGPLRPPQQSPPGREGGDDGRVGWVAAPQSEGPW